MSSRTDRFKTNNAMNKDETVGPYGPLFLGQKSQFRRLEDSLKTYVSNEIGREALDYLFENWPEDAASTEENPIYNIHKQYLPMKTPELLENELEVQATTAQGVLRFNADGSKLMRAITEDDKDKNRKSVAAISKFNSKTQSLITGCQRILSEHCGPAIRLKFNEFAGDPIKSWNYLKMKFGPISCGHTDLSTECIHFINMTMGHEERFENFMAKLNISRTFIKANKDLPRALLLSDGTSDRKIQMLPDRLMAAVTKCVQDNKSYTECVAYISHQDSMAHEAGRLQPNRSVRAVQEQKMTSYSDKAPAEDFLKGNCFNCGNRGHASSTCATPACGFCELFHCGHKSDSCPVRKSNGKQKQIKPASNEMRQLKTKRSLKAKESPVAKKVRFSKKPDPKSVKKIRASASFNAEETSEG